MHGLPGKATIRPRKASKWPVGGWAIAVWFTMVLAGWGQQSPGQTPEDVPEAPSVGPAAKASESPSGSSARSPDSSPEASPPAEISPEPSSSAENAPEPSSQAKSTPEVPLLPTNAPKEGGRQPRSTPEVSRQPKNAAEASHPPKDFPEAGVPQPKNPPEGSHGAENGPVASPPGESAPKPSQSGTSSRQGSRSSGGESASESGQGPYLLRYKFHPGETIRWEVTHQALIRTTVSGVSQTAESVSRSVKVWKVLQVQPDGTAILEHMVENVRMWQKLTGRQEVRYDSQTDKDPPPGFQTIAKSIGVPLAKITLSPSGKVLHRQRYISQPQEQPDSPITMPLPAEPVAVGGSWSETLELEVPLETGAVRKVRTKQMFTLQEVRDHIATIEAATQILTPNLPPEVEAKLIQQASAGTIRFDLHRGRVIEQQIEVDKRVIGFRGEASSLHCMSRFHEKLLPAEHTARRP
jgi:hypothetical protein